jgi:hypothetical protein
MIGTVKRLLQIGTILLSATAAMSAATSTPVTAESGSMILIGGGLVLTASIARLKLKSR